MPRTTTFLTRSPLLFCAYLRNQVFFHCSIASHIMAEKAVAPVVSPDASCRATSVYSMRNFMNSADENGSHVDVKDSPPVDPFVQFVCGDGWTPYIHRPASQPVHIPPPLASPPPVDLNGPAARTLERSDSTGSISDSDLLQACEDLESGTTLPQVPGPSFNASVTDWWPRTAVDGTERFPVRGYQKTAAPSVPLPAKNLNCPKLCVINGPSVVGKTVFSEMLVQDYEKTTTCRL